MPEPLEPAGIHRIIVCRSVHRLGSALILTPLLEELALRFPGAKVDLLGRCAVAEEVYGGHPAVGDILPLPDHALSHPVRTMQALRHARGQGYDLAIDPDLLSRSSRWLARHVHARHALGFIAPRKRGALTHLVYASGCPRHRALWAVYLVRAALGIPPFSDPWPRLRLPLTADERREGGAMLARSVGTDGGRQPCVGVFANATGMKRLPREWWDRFLPALEAAAPGHAWAELLPPDGISLLGARYPCIHSANVRKVAAALSQLRLFVTADCGVMHLASGSGTTTIGLFRASDPAEWRPYGGENRAIVTTGQSPEAVASEVAEVLRATPAAAPDTI